VRLVGKLVTSGELARELGVSASAVRSWVRDGLITASVRTPGGHRRYDVDEVRQRLRELADEAAHKDDEGPDA
jgi:DNA-binding transcriptional MerR regulator